MVWSFSDNPESRRTLPFAFYLHPFNRFDFRSESGFGRNDRRFPKCRRGLFQHPGGRRDSASASDCIVVQSGIYYESLVVETRPWRSVPKPETASDVAKSARDGLPVLAVSGGAAVGLSGLGLYRAGGNGPWNVLGASARLELDGVCIGWGYAKAGSVHIEYDGKGARNRLRKRGVRAMKRTCGSGSGKTPARDIERKKPTMKTLRSISFGIVFCLLLPLFRLPLPKPARTAALFPGDTTARADRAISTRTQGDCDNGKEWIGAQQGSAAAFTSTTTAAKTSRTRWKQPRTNAETSAFRPATISSPASRCRGRTGGLELISEDKLVYGNVFDCSGGWEYSVVSYKLSKWVECLDEDMDTDADGRAKSTTGDGVADRHFSYGAKADGTRRARTDYGSRGSDMWEEAVFDMAGRLRTIRRPAFGEDGAVYEIEYVYDEDTGMLAEIRRPDTAPFLVEYDEAGRVERTGLDLDFNVNPGLTDDTEDRISEYETKYEQDGYRSLTRRTRTLQKPGSNCKSVPLVESVRKEALGSNLWTAYALGANLIFERRLENAFGNETAETVAATPQKGRVEHRIEYHVDVDPDTVDIAETLLYEDGLPAKFTGRTGEFVEYDRDGLGRIVGVADSRTGTARIHYDDANRIHLIQDPAGNRESYAYDCSTGRLVSKTDALGRSTRCGYDDLNRISEIRTFRQGSDWNSEPWPDRYRAGRLRALPLRFPHGAFDLQGIFGRRDGVLDVHRCRKARIPHTGEDRRRRRSPGDRVRPRPRHCGNRRTRLFRRHPGPEILPRPPRTAGDGGMDDGRGARPGRVSIRLRAI